MVVAVVIVFGGVFICGYYVNKSLGMAPAAGRYREKGGGSSLSGGGGGKDEGGTWKDENGNVYAWRAPKPATRSAKVAVAPTADDMVEQRHGMRHGDLRRTGAGRADRSMCERNPFRKNITLHSRGARPAPPLALTRHSTYLDRADDATRRREITSPAAAPTALSDTHKRAPPGRITLDTYPTLTHRGAGVEDISTSRATRAHTLHTHTHTASHTHPALSLRRGCTHTHHS